MIRKFTDIFKTTTIQITFRTCNAICYILKTRKLTSTRTCTVTSNKYKVTPVTCRL